MENWDLDAADLGQTKFFGSVIPAPVEFYPSFIISETLLVGYICSSKFKRISNLKKLYIDKVQISRENNYYYRIKYYLIDS